MIHSTNGKICFACVIGISIQTYLFFYSNEIPISILCQLDTYKTEILPTPMFSRHS